MNSSLAEKEKELIEQYSLIEDRHERLSAIISHRLAGQELSEFERIDADLVRGCATRVWLRVVICDEKMDVRYAAEGSIVKGMVALLASLYQGSGVDDAAVFSPQLLEGLGLTKMLSPTRLQGLGKVMEAIHYAATGRINQRGDSVQKA